MNMFRTLELNGNVFKIDNCGRSIYCNGDYITQHKSNGYKCISAGNASYYVHRLVALAWIGEPAAGHDKVNFLDGNKTNTHCGNLRWVSAKELTLINGYRYYMKHGTKPPPPVNPATASKIPDADVPKIFERIHGGETLKSIAAEYGTSDMSISRLKKRFKKLWEHAE